MSVTVSCLLSLAPFLSLSLTPSRRSDIDFRPVTDSFSPVLKRPPRPESRETLDVWSPLSIIPPGFFIFLLLPGQLGFNESGEAEMKRLRWPTQTHNNITPSGR